MCVKSFFKAANDFIVVERKFDIDGTKLALHEITFFEGSKVIFDIFGEISNNVFDLVKGRSIIIFKRIDDRILKGLEVCHYMR
jgi:hypothetical protein